MPPLLSLISLAACLTPVAHAQSFVLAPQDPLAPAAAPALSPSGLRDVAVDVRIDEAGASAAVAVTLTFDPSSRRPDGNPPQPIDLLLPAALVDSLEIEGPGAAPKPRRMDAAEGSLFLRELSGRRADIGLLELYGQSLYYAELDAPADAEPSSVELRFRVAARTQGADVRTVVPLHGLRHLAEQVALKVTGAAITVEPVTTIYSPTHALELEPPFESGPSSSLRQHQPFHYEDPAAALDVDLVIVHRAPPASARADDWLDVTLLTDPPGRGEDGTFLALIQGLEAEDSAPLPKDVVFVLDRSGSMNGAKFDQARAALDYLIGRLGAEDRFGLIDYSSGVEHFAERLQVATAAARRDAQRYLSQLEPEGGTNIEAALSAAFAYFQNDDAFAQVVFLTDGMPTEGLQEAQALASALSDRNEYGARVIAYGLGFDVNAELLDRLARTSRGLAEYVLPTEDIAAAVPGFYARSARPLLIDTRIAFSGAGVHDVLPSEPGDLYAGHRTLLVGRFSQPGKLVIELAGSSNGASIERRFEFPVGSTNSGGGTLDSGAPLARLWAARQIGARVDELRLERAAAALDPAADAAADPGSDPRVQTILDLGLRYGVLTEYTAFLASPETALHDSAANVAHCGRLMRDGAAVGSGSHGFAQACNNNALVRSDQATTSNSWLDASGSRVTVSGVRCVGERTFFNQQDGWRQAATSGREADAQVELQSAEFYALLDENAWLARCVARTGPCTVELDGRVVSFTNATDS